MAGKAWTEADDEVLTEAVIKTIESQCPDLRKFILDSYVVSPRLLAERYNLASLSCWHLPMTGEHLFEKRSLPGCDHYQTPFANLFLCSAGTYPGGNVTAAPGHNLAKLLIEKYGNEVKTPGITQMPAQTANR
jgi:phytoene dehydrogenase-like protein